MVGGRVSEAFLSSPAWAPVTGTNALPPPGWHLALTGCGNVGQQPGLLGGLQELNIPRLFLSLFCPHPLRGGGSAQSSCSFLFSLHLIASP